MRLDSHGTAGARRRLRHHCKQHRALTYKGRSRAGDWIFECHGTDGRTYIVRLNAGDLEALHAAGLVPTVQSVIDGIEGGKP